MSHPHVMGEHVMGEVVHLPVPTLDHTGPAADLDASAHAAAPDGSGDGGRDDPPPALPADSDPSEDGPDAGEVVEGTVMVDRPGVDRLDPYTRFMRAKDAQRRPIIAGWLRNAEDAKATARWAVGYAAHIAVFHAVRVPVYALVLAGRSPRGLWRVLRAGWGWTFDAEGMALRTRAADRNDAEAYMRLLDRRDDRVRWRRIVAGSGAGGVAYGVFLAASAPFLAQFGAVAAVVGVLGWLGTPADKPVFGVAVVATKTPPLTSEIIIRAMGALGIGEINKSLARSGGKDWFPAPITRDGPGWRADIDLPYGVTATDLMEKRRELASGLRRPVGCVWPESEGDEEHAGRLVLWVGDQPMSKLKKTTWPLAKAGQVDLFRPVPFATDQRGRAVLITLMFISVIIGSVPRMGKTFTLRLLLLIAALDPRAQIHAYDLKGTGDLDALEPVAHAHRAGEEEEDIEYAVRDMRALQQELRRRAKVIRSLPKTICPENKVTPELATRTDLRLHPIVIGVDECQKWFEHKKYGSELEEICEDLVKRGPAVGMLLILATQRPDAKSLPTGISANAVVRICLKVMGHTENDMVLGSSMHKNGIRATMFAFKDKGIAYYAGEGEAPRIVATAYIDAPAAEAIAQRGRAMRIAAGTLTGYAAGADTAAATIEDVAAVLVDVLAVTQEDEDKIRSYVVVDRLADYKPTVYGPWTQADAGLSEAEVKTAKAAALAGALKPYGITTVQVNRTGPNGRREIAKASSAPTPSTVPAAANPDPGGRVCGGSTRRPLSLYA